MPTYASSKLKTEQEYADHCRDALAKLEELGVPVPTLLAQAKGIACFKCDKIAVIAGMEHGHGFALSLLRPGVWSAPVYLRLDVLSLGLQLTHATHTTVMFFRTEEAVRSLCRDQVKLGVEHDARLAGGLAQPDAVLAPRSAGSQGGGVLGVYTVSSGGTLLDASLGGGMLTTDGAALQQFYGTGVAIGDILAGNNAKAPQPVMFRELYAYLDQRAAAGGMTS